MFEPVTEDFASFTAPSTWATANSSANQLDSDIWAFSSTNTTSSAASTFGLNYILGRGVSSGGVDTFGVYAIDTGAGLKGIGPQANDASWSPGHLTVKLQNDTGVVIEKLRIEWTYLIYNDQDGRRASQLALSSTDETGSYLTVVANGFMSTQDTPSSSPFWIPSPREGKITVNLAPGDDYYLRWTFYDYLVAGSGENRDETGIADIRITPIVELPGDFDDDGDADGDDFLAWQRGDSPHAFSAADLAEWETSYGDQYPLAATATAVPEPAAALALQTSLLLSLVGWRKLRESVG